MFTSLQTPQFAMSALLVVALLAYFTVKWYLSSRQIQHIFAHRTQVPAAFSHQISLDEHQNAADYALAKLQMARKELCVDVFLVLFWSLGGGFSLLIKYSLMLSQDPLYFGLILMVLFSLLNGMLNLPLEYLSLFRVERKFGFNKMSKKLWLSDLLTSTVLSLVVGVPLLYAILLFIQQQPDSWWFWAWALFVGLNILMLWLYPTVIAPLFNQFKPLESGKLKIRLNQLLKRCGFKSSGMFVMDGSRRSAHGNAYFTGFGENKRIVFFDTLLTQLNDVQIEAVLAHELGHFQFTGVYVARFFVQAGLVLFGIGW
jgi:STE24 endopeptidase